MGYELNQLMKRYGVSTPTMSSYGGMGAPTALAADATAAQKDQFVTDSGNYMAQKAAYDQYKNDYQNRIASTSAYQDSPLFKGEKKSWDTPLKTPTYSLASPKTNADYDQLIKEAFGTIGRSGFGDKVSNIDQPTYDDMMFQLKTGAVSTDDFSKYFTKRANDYMNQNPDTELTQYVKGYQNPKAGPNWGQWKDHDSLGNLPLSGQTPAATPEATSTPAVTPTVTPTPTEEEDPYSYASVGTDYLDRQARGGHIKYAHGGPVHNFSGGGYNKIDGGINDLVDKYDLANPAELPVMMAKNDTGTMTDAVPSVPVSDAKLQEMQNSAVRAGEPPMQRGPVPPAEGNPEMTTPSPTGGATLGAAPAPAPAPSGQTPLEVLHQKYLNAGRQPKSAEMTAAEQKYASKNDALISLLKEQANKTEDNAPSKAEMYFRLAAALAAPTKTGAFTENMGLAAKELADFQKSTTDAKKAAAAAKLQLLLKTGEIDAQQAKEELSNLKEGEKEGRDVARTFAMKEYETEAKKGEPQSADEKEAIALGKKKGTPEFTQFIQDKEARRREKEDTELTARKEESARKKTAETKLAPQDVKMKSNIENEINTYKEALIQIENAIKHSDKAFTGSLPDQLTMSVVKNKFGKADPRVTETENLKAALGSSILQSAASMKGSLSDKDLGFLKEISGAAMTSKEARNTTLSNARDKISRAIKRAEQEFELVSSGKYSQKAESAPEAKETE